ncbi:hypothetical protein GX888_00925 [Candidatus Dojkabacteria bacterium]|uniref:RNA 2',3'-cyclic phosphodiesterase n=1 Tax=Candidatus Dojkabacteria bacterium TaxID=2099670 RepID=A0A847VCV2_9BACT|nr:hypothetical protein [Candidatus Dojkabacteria bacterium]
MSYFLGFVVDKESRAKIREVAASIKQAFDDFGIPVRWSKPSTYHITLYYLGERHSFLENLILNKRVGDVEFESIDIKFGSVKVGISRNYKELIYLDLKEGGEKLRELLLKLRKQLGQKDTSLFVPHLTLGRLSKEVSIQEYRNIVKDMSNMSKRLDISDIHFTAKELYLIESKDGVYSFKMKFEAK